MTISRAITGRGGGRKCGLVVKRSIAAPSLKTAPEGQRLALLIWLPSEPTHIHTRTNTQTCSYTHTAACCLSLAVFWGLFRMKAFLKCLILYKLVVSVILTFCNDFEFHICASEVVYMNNINSISYYDYFFFLIYTIACPDKHISTRQRSSIFIPLFTVFRSNRLRLTVHMFEKALGGVLTSLGKASIPFVTSLIPRIMF